VVLPGLGNITRNVFFQYVQNFTFVGVETQQATIQIQADAHFLCMMTAYDTSLAAAGGFGAGTASQFGGTLVALTDASGGRFLSTGPMPASTLFGTAQRPFVWPYTHMFRANGGITIQATGVIAAAQTVRYVFSGFKLPIGDAPEVGY
jgi:hypothetical protein